MDFQKKIVTGLSDSVLTIDGLTETTISFSGQEAQANFVWKWTFIVKYKRHGKPTTARKPKGAMHKLSSARVERALQQGKRLPPENLLLVAENSMAMAARYQPELTNRETGEKQP